MSNLVLFLTLIITHNLLQIPKLGPPRKMYGYRPSIVIPLYFCLNQVIYSVSSSNSPVVYHPLENIAVTCGSSGNSTGLDGRQWIGDIGSRYTPVLQDSKGKLISSKAINLPLSPDPVPYTTARLSRWPFTYTFQVTPGHKFIRLHFYPASYWGGFEKSKAFFTVKAGPYTLLSNFSVSLTVDDLGLQYLVKEYCVNVEENQPLVLTFSPSLGGSSDGLYAFVNRIEIVSMPAALYHTREGDAGAHVVGEESRFPIGKSIALEMVQRLNVGGSSISSVEDTGMFRDWSHDSNFLLEKINVQPVTITLRIKYTGIPSYTAPQQVYQTSWSIVTDKQGNGSFNFSWKLHVDLGFRYLLRLHFCDFEYDIEESDHLRFSIFVNEHVAEAKADIIKWSGGNRAAIYKDYVVMMEGDRMEGKHDLLIAFFPCNHERIEHIDAILKGLEVFKLSNPDRNLAGVNPMPLAHASSFSNQNRRKFVYASGGNAIATIVVILLTLLSIGVYQLRVWVENIGKKNITPLLPDGLCRLFSLFEVLSVTKNFDDELIIGSGGFGNVYKAVIDEGKTTVAIKRLNSKSKQGAEEFWTEIEMLSNLRHTHLVSLIGYCDEHQEMILIYEYMDRGTLADKLYTFGDVIVCPLSWEQRMKICIGAARGLDYLHTGTPRGMIHRDVKTTNILLDKDWVAKISDFGLCKLGTTNHSHTHVSTDVKGTFGFLDPEYFLTRRLTKKSDVYAFGVVLLEVLCGRPAVDIQLEEEQRSLAQWAQQCIKEKKLDQLVDPSLRDQLSPERLQVFAEVANKCLHSRPSGRPTMTDVVASLECMLASQDQPINAFTDEEDGKGEEEEEEEDGDVIDYGGSNQHIDDDENTQEEDNLSQGNVACPSTLVQYNENTQHQKRSKNLFQKGFAFLARVMDVWSMRTSNVEIRTTVASELIRQESISLTTSSTPSDDSNISGTLHFSAMTGTNIAYPDEQILPTPDLRIFRFLELKKATRNFRFDTFLGEGRFGQVYKGRLDEKVTSDNGSGLVAVKKMDYQSIQIFEDWQSEVCLWGRFSHLNLVKLLGFCHEDEKVLLVYEFMQNGSLEDHLFRRGSTVQPLLWEIRVKILIGAARGLAFLHTLEPRVIFREFKASNILLDGRFNSKISDLQLDSPESSYGVYVPTLLTGENYSIPYVAPEYLATGHVDVKSVVYSFGVVLLEMLTGLRARDVRRPRGQQNLVDWVKPYFLHRSKWKNIIDSRLEGEYPIKAARLIAHLALNCLGTYPKSRPSMKQVVEILESVDASSKNPSPRSR